MPEKGWKTITIDEDVYEKARDFIRDYNKAKGAKILRSMAHLVEQAIIEFLQDHSKKLKELQSAPA